MTRHGATLTLLSRIGASVVAVMCGIALTGWLLNIPVLSSIVPGWPRMAPIVILCFLLCLAALFALTMPAGGKSDLIRVSAAALVLAISAYFLVNFAVNGVPAGGSPVNLLAGKLGRPSPASAINLLAAAIALMLPRKEGWGQVYGGLIGLGLVITGLDFMGYAYGIAALSREPTVSAMSLPTMSSFLLLFGSALLARPYDGWTAILFAHNSGGIAARRLFPAMLILPFAVNGMVVLAYRFRPFEAPFGFAILSVATTVGLGIVTLTIANWLAHHEDEWRRS
jgi:hypothetical protein